MKSFSQDELAQAKSISIMGMLEQGGHEYKRKDASGFWYLSPLRNETTASFVVYRNTNKFKDFGTGVNGDAITLTMKLQNLSYVDAVKTLLANIFSFETLEQARQAQQVPSAHEPKKEVIIESVKPLQNSSLVKYVESRKINIKVAKQYLQEIYYKYDTTQEKSYFGVCMQNESKGYAVRNSYGKHCLINMNYTFIDNGFSDTVSIFEGMFDFLACITYKDKPIKSNVIILHSITNVSKVINHFPKEVKQVFLLLDNDKAGQTATDELTQHFNNFALVKDKRNIFAGYKDFGEFVEKANM